MESHDKRLAAYFEAVTEPERKRRLEALLSEDARPVILKILARKTSLGSNGAADRLSQSVDLDDLEADVVRKLIVALEASRADWQAKTHHIRPIRDFAAYVAVTAYHCVSEHLRSAHSGRSRQKSQLRYLLDHREGLAAWVDADGVLCAGFAQWRKAGGRRVARGLPFGASARLGRFLGEPEAAFRKAAPTEDPAYLDPAKLVALILDGIGAPVALDDLVTIVAALNGVQDDAVRGLPPEETTAATGFGANVGEEVMARFDIRAYWRAITALPVKQCGAILLQGRDPNGNSVVELLETEGVANLNEIAGALGLAPGRLAEIYNDLPMEDTEVGKILGVTAQHVARMRMQGRRVLTEAFSSS